MSLRDCPRCWDYPCTCGFESAKQAALDAHQRRMPGPSHGFMTLTEFARMLEESGCKEEYEAWSKRRAELAGARTWDELKEGE